MGMEIENGILKKYTGESGVTEVIIPEGVTEIGAEAFWNCGNLTSVRFPKSLRVIGEDAFSCTNVTEVQLPEGLAEIGDAAFWGCTQLRTVYLPGSLREMGDHMFSGCDALESVTIAEGVPYLPHAVFGNCDRLSSLVLPKSIEFLEPEALFGCSGLQHLIILNSDLHIGYNAFFTCDGLTDVHWAGRCRVTGIHYELSNALYDLEKDEISEAMEMAASGHYRTALCDALKIPFLLGIYWETHDKDTVPYIEEFLCNTLLPTVRQGELPLPPPFPDWVCLPEDCADVLPLFDQFLDLAAEREWHEVYLTLMQYKKDILGYSDAQSKFQL